MPRTHVHPSADGRVCENTCRKGSNAIPTLFAVRGLQVTRFLTAFEMTLRRWVSTRPSEWCRDIAVVSFRTQWEIFFRATIRAIEFHSQCPRPLVRNDNAALTIMP